MLNQSPRNKAEEAMKATLETLIEGFKVKAALLVLMTDERLPNVVCTSSGELGILHSLPEILRELADEAEKTLHAEG